MMGNQKNVCVFEIASCFSFISLYSLSSVWLWFYGLFLVCCAFLTDPATGYAENKWRAVLDVPKFLLTPLEWILESFV